MELPYSYLANKPRYAEQTSIFQWITWNKVQNSATSCHEASPSPITLVVLYNLQVYNLNLSPQLLSFFLF
ncbi:hypothetical protein IEQ34_015860 [Dendrobium chrysotoxum]|uniref:Uncharacterized protein n=1 Tax=Dendrobium chrysotoxum TaxID=161865 RepID=A0AAV7GJN2_DENCH|nr:hypothetical protein IEQ34_015860 [Dendrobium chrysotoxum]